MGRFFLVSFVFVILFGNLAFAQVDDSAYKTYINTEIDKNVKEKRILAEEQIIRNLENTAKEKEIIKKNESDFIERKIMISNSVKIDSKLNISIRKIGNSSKIGVYLSNDEFIEIKYLPDQASAIALKNVNKNLEGLESRIELKEVEIGKKNKLVYQVNAEKKIKILGLFESYLKVKAYVDAETGEVIELEKPWWIALAN